MLWWSVYGIESGHGRVFFSYASADHRITLRTLQLPRLGIQYHNTAAGWTFYCKIHCMLPPCLPNISPIWLKQYHLNYKLSSSQITTICTCNGCKYYIKRLIIQIKLYHNHSITIQLHNVINLSYSRRLYWCRKLYNVVFPWSPYMSWRYICPLFLCTGTGVLI